MKNTKLFYCNACGAGYPKWIGKCEDCGQWNSIVENQKNNGLIAASNKIDFKDLSYKDSNIMRKLSGIAEFDRVLGGGAVPGSVVLIGGDPGIGKSTLLLQIMTALANQYSCVYISGEESAQQICMRAERLGVSKSNVKLACEISVESIINSLDASLDFLVIDSIQTLQSQSATSIPGTIMQVRSCAYELINFAKTKGTVVFLVGHVTKEGMIAGPKVLEHMVDTVLYFEGERGISYRILRAVKNRYGPCDELGIFEMSQHGLSAVSNPSALFLTERSESVPGTTIFSGIEGSRPLLIEVQALVSKSYFSSPRRTVVGWDINRLFTILAVLESKCKISFADRDVYLNIAGGLKISEPACDLAVAISLLSARSGNVFANETCAFGEIGLTGEIRSVTRTSDRLKEAEKLGFKNIILPYTGNLSSENHNLNLLMVKNLKDVVKALGVTNGN